jgi:hypothetical protein
MVEMTTIHLYVNHQSGFECIRAQSEIQFEDVAGSIQTMVWGNVIRARDVNALEKMSPACC